MNTHTHTERETAQLEFVEANIRKKEDRAEEEEGTNGNHDDGEERDEKSAFHFECM